MATKVKRYGLDDFDGIVERPDGPFVDFDEYLVLQEQLAELKQAFNDSQEGSVLRAKMLAEATTQLKLIKTYTAEFNPHTQATKALEKLEAMSHGNG